ncbi:MAG: STAS domain-containing protein [Sediminibacterium sp.]|jgi:anti-anti-sigma factor|nr:STAS domain-containing protein [Sediminibacterium sp.]MBP6144935.1 STAS domain-containing protein [Sediminibacterium sp.]
MHYKIDTKEKFTVLSLLDASLSSNLVPELNELIQKLGNNSPKNLVVNLSGVKHWELGIMEVFAKHQEVFYDNNTSFVLCCLSDDLQNALDLTEFGEVMNLTPTESEAWDIVQMEEIERELLDSDDMEFSTQE